MRGDSTTKLYGQWENRGLLAEHFDMCGPAQYEVRRALKNQKSILATEGETMTIEAKLDKLIELGEATVKLLTAQVSGGTRPPKAEKVTAEKVKAEPPKTEPVKEPEPEDDLGLGDDTPPAKLTADDVRKHLVAYQTQTSRDDVRILLKKYEAKSLPELKEDKFPAICAEVVKALGADAEKKLAAAAASMKK